MKLIQNITFYFVQDSKGLCGYILGLKDANMLGVLSCSLSIKLNIKWLMLLLLLKISSQSTDPDVEGTVKIDDRIHSGFSFRTVIWSNFLHGFFRLLDKGIIACKMIHMY